MKIKKPYSEMTTGELREVTEDLNGTVLDKTRPLTARERALWRKAGGHDQGKSHSGQVRDRINISLERGLLQKADKVAKKQGLNRSELIAQALTTVIGRKAG